MDKDTLKTLLALVNKSFDEEVWANGCETVMGFECNVEGKQDFLDNLEAKILKEFNMS